MLYSLREQIQRQVCKVSSPDFAGTFYQKVSQFSSRLSSFESKLLTAHVSPMKRFNLQRKTFSPPTNKLTKVPFFRASLKLQSGTFSCSVDFENLHSKIKVGVQIGEQRQEMILFLYIALGIGRSH